VSSLPDRRNSPRRNIDRSDNWPLPLRFAVAMYTPLALIVFASWGEWQALVVTLSMLHWLSRPLKGAWL
jgi:hypothetical protein